RIERLRLRLQGEGLFDQDRKRPLPFLPALIGLVTSPQGAVLHDIRTTIARRFPRSLLLWPVPVQGEGAAARIAAAIAGFDRRTGPGAGSGSGLPRPDVLIVARGGGSLEDLAAFSDEAVLRAVAACTIPVISAVGHETDTTLIDFVSDRRAPTPTAAAEMAVPARADLLADLAHRAARLENGLFRTLQQARTRLDRAAAALPDLPSLLNVNRQRLDDRLHRLELSRPALFAARRTATIELAHRLRQALPALLSGRRTALLAAERRLPDPRRSLATAGARLAVLSADLERGLPALLAARRTALLATERRLPDPRRPVETGRASLLALSSRLRPALDAVLHRGQAEAARRRADLAVLAARLESASPSAVLARGYVLVQDRDGHPVTRAAGLRPGSPLTLRFGDGTVSARTERDAAQGRLDI
ncbi:MAG: exodeoxyribonuclease VII large subunit, partial [Gluconacetobacter diazotrophicus]|nr:exodeoxyribonuclease VII large subunit [Gluconacetobacter diazotrophicus]